MRNYIIIGIIIAILAYIFILGRNSGEAKKELESNKIAIEQQKQVIETKNEIIKTKKRQQDIVNIQNDNVESRIKWLHLIYEKGGYSSTSE